MRVHLFPFRTQKLSSPVPTILAWRRAGKIGQCQHKKRELLKNSSLFLCWASRILQGEPCKIPRCARRCLAAQDALTRIEFEAGFAAPSSSPAGSRHNKRSKSKRSSVRGTGDGSLSHHLQVIQCTVPLSFLARRSSVQPDAPRRPFSASWKGLPSAVSLQVPEKRMRFRSRRRVS